MGDMVRELMEKEEEGASTFKKERWSCFFITHTHTDKTSTPTRFFLFFLFIITTLCCVRYLRYMDTLFASFKNYTHTNCEKNKKTMQIKNDSCINYCIHKIIKLRKNIKTMQIAHKHVLRIFLSFYLLKLIVSIK